MRAHAAERQQADIHSPSHKRPGNAQDARCVLRCDLCIVGEHGHAIRRGKPVEQVGKGRQGGSRKRDGILSPIIPQNANIGPGRCSQRRSSTRTVGSLS